MGLFNTLATIGAVGAVAGFAWRWMQRHRGGAAAPYRDLSRWEGEGGALAGASGTAAPEASRSPAPGPGVGGSSNGAGAWPFPHSTRH